ncbi:hypothetical protein M5689_023051 [Euphorbia peplus]|nr:hypothetical protein M5689_023051 [Euphorbia peplus]
MYFLQELQLAHLEFEASMIRNKVRFVHQVVTGEITFGKKRSIPLFLELHQKGYTPILEKQSYEKEHEIAEGAVASNGVRANGYRYLTSMSIGSLSYHERDRLSEELEKINGVLQKLGGHNVFEK